jgi:WD40 repeat protein
MKCWALLCLGLLTLGAACEPAPPQALTLVVPGPVPVLEWPAHPGACSLLRFSPDGEHLVTGGMDSDLKIWDARTGRLRRTFRGGGAPCLALDLSPDGTLVASANDPTAIRVWNLATGREVARLDHHASPPSTLAFSPDGSRLASGGRDQILIIWDIETGQPIQELNPHGHAITLVRWGTGGHLASAALGCPYIRLHDSANGQELRKLAGYDLEDQYDPASPNGLRRLWVEDAAFSPDGSLIATADFDDTVRVWDSASGYLLKAVQENRTVPYRLAFDPGGKWVACVDHAGDLAIVELESEQVVKRLPLGDGLLAFQIRPDSGAVAASYEDGMVRIWTLEEKRAAAP